MRERNQDTNGNIRFSFYARAIFKNQVILWLGLGFKIWDKFQCQTDTSSSALDQETCWSLSHPYKSPPDSYMCVHNDMCQRSWDTGAGRHTCTQLERSTLRHFQAQTAILQNWKRRQRKKLKQQSFHARVPTNYSLLTQHQTPQLHPATSFSLCGFRHRGFKYLAC